MRKNINIKGFLLVGTDVALVDPNSTIFLYESFHMKGLLYTTSPAHYAPFALILWYVVKTIYLLWEKYQFAIKSSNLFFNQINLIVRAFFVR